jgi:carbamoyl-phosphate synthase small subunit
MRGGVFDASLPESAAAERIRSEPPMAGRDLAREVSPGAAQAFEGGDGPLVLGIDTGIKTSIVRNLRERGVRLELHPCSTSAEQLLARRPDAVFLANGPGDPAALGYLVDTVRGLVGQVPVWGICLGHQLLCRAVGLETFKLPFGHRGANHPVKDLETGRIEITSQNHGFAVLGPGGQRTIDTDEPVRWETDFGVAELQQLNLYDRTVEGLVLRDVPASTVQYHPEAGPGPHDALHLFDRFLERLVAA